MARLVLADPEPRHPRKDVSFPCLGYHEKSGGYITRGAMDTDDVHQAFRNAVYASPPDVRPQLWNFAKRFFSELNFQRAERWMLERYGCLDENNCDDDR